VNDPIALAYYANQAANRRHFQTLFLAVSGFAWGFALAVLVLTGDSPLALGTAGATAASGGVLIGGAFIARRLLLRERAALAETIAVWRVLQGQADIEAPARAKPGAMAIACAGQALTGGALLALGLGAAAAG